MQEFDNLPKQSQEQPTSHKLYERAQRLMDHLSINYMSNLVIIAIEDYISWLEDQLNSEQYTDQEKINFKGEIRKLIQDIETRTFSPDAKNAARKRIDNLIEEAINLNK